MVLSLKMIYPVKTPWLLRKLYPSCIWKMPAENNLVYLSFDDGPHPEITTFVLDCLKEYNWEATFFCIGKNAEANPFIVDRILSEGHSIGNHTFNHLNGWKTSDQDYFDNVVKARTILKTDLFRPPYGRASHFQINCLNNSLAMKIIMWTVLSGDFDPALSKEECFRNVYSNLEPGNIIVFHDSVKAKEKLKYALPLVLAEMKKAGFKSAKISSANT